MSAADRLQLHGPSLPLALTLTNASTSGLQPAHSQSDQNGRKAGQDSIAGRGIAGCLGLPRHTLLDPQPEDMKGASLLPPAPAAPQI